jgi:predicted MPP superfamily phosphohydrolase
MKSQIRYIFLFFLFLILLIDGTAFTGLWFDFRFMRDLPAILAYWAVPAGFIISLHIYGRKFLADNRPGFFAGFYVFTGVFLAFYVPKLFYSAFFLLEIMLEMLVYPVALIFPEPGSQGGSLGNGPGGSPGSGPGGFLLDGPAGFVSMIVLPVSVSTLFIILGGMLFGRFNFQTRRHEIVSADLPGDFDGFRIVHISDLHLGSLYGHREKLRKVVDMINREKPDLILFTGDLVNNLAEEAEGWTNLLEEMKAGHGKFSILGNHDYGEYYNWPDDESRQENMKRLIGVHEQSGFTLLLNRSTVIRNGGSALYLAGVENWGLPPFRQYGDLDKALRDVPEKAFTLLLSHDPSHWDAEILAATGVQLTLSGHTHGMQFGIRTRKIKWSPIQMKYPRWIGLYREGSRYLHVNPGLGYIGYAGRIFIPPEISLLVLKSQD